jgi:exosortase A-associated hydrolase 1
MNIDQRALRFHCHGCSLVGIVDVPERPLPRGVLIIADVRQYRVGSHRQSTLLSRVLAARGIPVMRFDRRGMGDSEGDPRGVDTIEDDVRAAMKEFFIHVPEMEEVVLLGLGDAAAAAAFYAPGDERVCGLLLLNPSLRGDQGEAREARQYYLARLGEVAFWKKVASGRVDFAASAAALRHNLRQAAHERRALLPRRFIDSVAGFRGQVLVVVGGDDPAAHQLARLLEPRQFKYRRVDIARANHTFASREWREEVATTSANWLVSW